MTDEPNLPEPVVPDVLPDRATAEEFTHALRAKLDGLEEGAQDALADIAHTRDAGLWKAMDYDSWAAYAEQELGMGKRQANRLVRHAIFAGELGPIGSHLKERQTRDVPDKARPRVAKKIIKATEGQPPEEAKRSAADILAAERAKVAKAKEAQKAKEPDPPKKATANFEVEVIPVSLVRGGEALTWLVAISVAAGEPREAMATKILRSVLETGEAPSFPTPNGKRLRQPAEPAASNGDCPKHVASKPGLSGLVVCELCGLPRNRWAVATSTAGAGPRVERQSVDVATAFKGSGKK